MLLENEREGGMAVVEGEKKEVEETLEEYFSQQNYDFEIYKEEEFTVIYLASGVYSREVAYEDLAEFEVGDLFCLALHKDESRGDYRLVV